MNMNLNFNWITYINNYKDLRDNNIITEDSALLHWITHGKIEKRTYIDNYNTNKIVILNDNIYSGYTSCIGHEIHINRFILIDLLLQNIIDINTIIVIKNEDRKFLYDSIFNNVIFYDNYKTFNIKNYIIIDLLIYLSTTYNILTHNLKSLNFSFNTNYLNDKNFIDNINKFNFNIVNYSLNNNYYTFSKDKFILIHSRYNNNDYIKIIEKIRLLNNNMNIVVFKKDIIFDNIQNVYYINNLQLYCKLLNNNNCILFISEWSGGGQLSQYCYNGKIMYYFSFYSSLDYVKNYLIYQEKSKTNYLNCWDFKTTTKCIIEYYKTINDLILAINL